MQIAQRVTKKTADIRRLGDIFAFESRPGHWLGYHARNLEVAILSPESWEALVKPLDNPEAFSQLKAWDQEVNPQVKSGRMTQSVRSLTLNVNQICNLHCSYCAAGGDGTFGDPVVKMAMDKTLPQLGFFLNKVPAGEKFRITFLGGEPLLYPQGIDLVASYAQSIAQARGFKMDFTVVTNGTLFTAHNIELLASIKAHITISIDGPAEINDLHRPSKSTQSSTGMVEKGLPGLLSRKNELSSIGMSGTFGRHNLELEKAWHYYRQWNLDWYDFTYDHQEKASDVSQLFTEKLLSIAEQAFALGGEHELRKIKYFDNIFQQLDQQQRVENFCGAGKSFLMIDAKNNIYTCPWVVGDKKEIVGAGEQLFEKQLQDYSENLVDKNNCQSCWARFICGGGCMFMHKNKTGNKHTVDDNFCQRTRTLIAEALDFYQQSRALA